jgi:hypothetical protein
MQQFHYSFAGLLPDWARGLAGLASGSALMIFTVPLSTLFYIGAVLTVLFALFLARTALRQRTAFAVDGEGVVARRSVFGGAWVTRIGWGDMRDVRLRYFSTRRDRSRGWLELKVAGSGGRFTADSALDGFPALVTAVTDAAERRGITLDAATAANLDLLHRGFGTGAPRGESIG